MAPSKGCKSCENGSCGNPPPKQAPAPPPPQEVLTPDQISKFSAWQLAQRGLLPRLQELVEKEGFDVNSEDKEGVSCLHWAAINNRLPCVKYLLQRGAKVDALGGELKSSPMQWATRQGHLHVIVTLMQHGADPNVRDIQGFDCLHLAAQFSFSNLAAYFVAKGVDIDSRDQAGRTALMWAAAKSHNPDLLRLLLGLGASINLQDAGSRSTALHFACAANNVGAMRILLLAGASKDIANDKGVTVRQMVWPPPPPGQALVKMNNRQRQLRNLLPRSETGPWSFLFRDPWRRNILLCTPLFGILAVGYSFNMMRDQGVWIGLAMVLASFFCWCASLTVFGSSYAVTLHAPNSLAMYYCTLTVFTGTYFLLYWPLMTSWENVLLLVIMGPLHWSFYKTNTTDPGTVTGKPSERNKTIIQLTETDQLTSENFCFSCVIRKPLRSKHCSACNRCVARFDHHCPFVDNDVGIGNHRYFMHYLMAFVGANLMFLLGTLRYYSTYCPAHESYFMQLWLRATCTPFITWLFVQGLVHTTWVTLLMVMHFKQFALDDLTTNEAVNRWRYRYLKRGRSPWHKGVLGNIIEFYNPTQDWQHVFEPPHETGENKL